MKLLKSITNFLKKYKILLQLGGFLVIVIISINYYLQVKIKDGLYLITNSQNTAEKSYISIKKNLVKYYLFPQQYEGYLNEQKEVIFDIGTIKLDYSDSGSIKYANFVPNSSETADSPIGLYLTKTKYYNAEYQEYLDKYKIYERELKRKESPFYKEALRRKNSDFLGELQTIDDIYKIKLLPLHTLSFDRERLDKATEFAGLFISKYDHSIKTYTFRDYRPKNGNAANIFTEATFHIVPAEKVGDLKLDISYFEDGLSNIYYQDKDVIFGTIPIGDGVTKPFVFFINFDETNQYYILGYGHGNNRQILDYYSVFRTISAAPERGEFISLEDITITSDEFYQRFGIRYEEFFLERKISYLFREALLSLTTAPKVFYNEKNQGKNQEKNSAYKTAYIQQYPLPSIYSRIKRYVQPLDEIKAALLEKHPKGKWLDHYFIHNSDPDIDSRVSFFYPLQENIWIEVELAMDMKKYTSYSPYDGHNLRKILYIKLLEHYDFSVIPKIPEEAIPNIGKYTYVISKDQNDTDTYSVKEGLIDSFGNLLIESNQD